MATLAADISATVRSLSVAGDVSLARKGLGFALDNEICELVDFALFPVVAGARQPGIDRSQWIVNRGVAGSVAASHSAGVTVRAALSATVVSASLTAPVPIVEAAAGALTAGPFMEPTTATPEAIVDWLIDNGFMDAA